MNLKVRPNARRNGVAGVDIDAEGRALLKVLVTATPEGGRANRAVIKLLAKRWKVAPGRFTLVNGATARQKVMEIVAADQALLDKVMKIEDTEDR